MSIGIMQRIQTAASVLFRRKGALEQAFLRGLDIEKLRTDVTNPYRQHAWVYACINVIMRKVSSVPFIIASRRKDEQGNQVELPDHPATKLFQTVNPLMGPSELWQSTVLFLYLRGETFWLLVFDENKNVTKIFPADPKSATPIIDQGNLVGWKISDREGRSVSFGRDEVVHFRFLNPEDPLRGLPPTEPAKLAIEQDFKAAKHNAALLDNSGVPGGIVTIPESLNEADLRREMRRWDQGHKGVTRAGSVAWLTGGMKFETLGLSQKELDFILGRRFNREEILAVFGVPPAEVGVHEFSNFANAKEQGRKFWNNTLLPLIVLLEETLDSKFFMRHFPEVVGFFDLANVEDLQDNLEKKSEVAVRLFGMGFTPAQINARLELGFETDQFQHLQQGYLPLALVPVGGEAAPPAPAPTPLAQLTARIKQREFARRVRDIYVSQTRRAIPRMRDALIDFFESEKAAVLSNIEEHYAALLREHGKSLKYLMTKWRSKKRDTEAINDFLAFYCKQFGEDVAGFIFSVEESTGNLRAVASPLTAQAVGESGQALASALGLSFDASAPEVIKALTERSNFLANVSNETFSKVRDRLLISIENGEPVREASTRIRDLYDGFSARRSQAIAQTEMGFAYNTAAFETYGQSGIQKHEWITADADARDSHLAAQAQGAVEIGKPFSNGLLYPNDPSGPPEEVVNCRCTTIPVIQVEAQLAIPARKSRPSHAILRASRQRTVLCLPEKGTRK